MNRRRSEITNMEEGQYEYFAFISYKREDEKWAKWLQRKLEYYKMPTSVRRANPNLPEKIRPVFKDTTDLEPGVLAQKIREALDSSKYLIVICSPRSANSVWVSKEVMSFINSGRIDHIIPFIIGGTPNAQNPDDECFPEGLRQLSGQQELLGANINEMGREAAAIKVIAQMFGLRFDALWQRYKRTQTMRNWGIVMFSLIVLIAAIFVAFLYVDRDRAYNTLERKNKELHKAYSDLEKTNNSLSNANDQISRNIIEINQKNDSLTALYVDRDRAYNTLESKNKELHKAYSDLARTNSSLSNANNQISRNIIEINQKNDSLTIINNRLEETNQALVIEKNNVGIFRKYLIN